jgi:hypothetical protein
MLDDTVGRLNMAEMNVTEKAVKKERSSVPSVAISTAFAILSTTTALRYKMRSEPMMRTDRRHRAPLAQTSTPELPLSLT